MALQVWLPLNGNLNNQGLSNVTVTNNGATVDNNGKIGKCYSFGDGSTSSKTKGIYINSNLSELGASRSICAWVYPKGNHLHYSGAIASSGDWNKSTKWGFCLKQDNTGFTGFDSGCSSYYSTTIPINTWTHLCVTVENGITKFYKNGEYLGQSSRGTGSISSDVNITYIGRESYASGYFSFNGNINDVRIYDHCLSPKEVKEISKGLILHYKLDGNDFSDSMESTLNLATYSTNYSNVTYGLEYTATGWGGDAGTITYYGSGGYNNGPYKIYHKTATGSGGIYKKLDHDIHIESGKTYTMSVYVKASRDYTDSSYSFAINRGTGNHYITGGTNVHFTTDWQRISKTFTATSADTGEYGEMCIIYDDNVTDYYVYYSCFQVEENDHATAYVNGSRNLEPTTNLLDYSNLKGHGSSWTLQSTTFHGNEIYKNVVTSPNTGNNAGFSIKSQITNSALSTATKVTLSFYKKLNTVYGKNLGGYLRVIKSDDTEATYYWSYNKSNWANDENSIGIWQHITSTVTIPTGCKAIKYCYVYTDSASSGDCDFSCIQLELKDHATPYINGTRTSSNNVIVYDSSGYENNGTITGTLTTNDDTPRYTASTIFNGNSKITSNDINLLGAGLFTISCWVYRTGSQNYLPSFWLGNGTSSLGIAIHGSAINRIEGGNGTNRFDNSAGTAVPVNTWAHLVLTYNGSNVIEYLNGSQVNSIAHSYGFGSTLLRMYIGYFWGASFTGRLSDVRLYATALSEDDVKELYNTAAFVTDSGTFAEYEIYEDNLSEVKKTGLLETANFYENGAEDDYSLDTDKTRVASNYIISEEFIEI